MCKKWHLGEDARATAGTPVFAIANGNVKEAQTHNSYGGTVIIEHTLPSGEQVVSLYGHMDVNSLAVRPGDDVVRGDYIGSIGTKAQNGGWSEHLHLAIHKGSYGKGSACGSDWLYAGYTSCESIKDKWYFPSDFIRSHSTAKLELRCSGEYCWTPASASDTRCEAANSWYVLGGFGVVERDRSICDERRQKLESIASQLNPSTQVPENKWWQSWFRSLLSLGLGSTALAAEVPNFTVERTIEIAVASSGSTYGAVVSGNGISASDAVGSGSSIKPTDSPKSGKPNFVGKSIRLYDTSGRERSSFKTFSNKPIFMRKWVRRRCFPTLDNFSGGGDIL